MPTMLAVVLVAKPHGLKHALQESQLLLLLKVSRYCHVPGSVTIVTRTTTA